MLGAVRRSFAAKLIVGGSILALVVVGGVAGYLILSRASQTAAAAQSNADNRAGVMAQVLDRFTGAQTLSAAASLASQAPLKAALAGPDPSGAVAALFATAPSIDVAGEILLVTDAGGNIVYTHASPSVDQGLVINSAPAEVESALRGGRCGRSSESPVAGGCGVEFINGKDPVYVVALPVTSATGTVGTVAYVAPLSFQLARFQALFGFPTAFIPAGHPGLEIRSGGGAGETAAALRDELGRTGGGTTFHAVYAVPGQGGASSMVAGSFVPVYGATHQLTGYIGVEVPLAQFVGDERGDILVVALIAIFVLLLVVIVVTLFVEQWVKRPVARLERGVARIAGGDYTTAIEVRSSDELGRLASDVNRMRDAIAEYVTQLREARERLNAAVETLSGVSRALTTTTTGVEALQQAVVRTAVALAGGAASATLGLRDGDLLVTAAQEGRGAPQLGSIRGIEAVLEGRVVDHRDEQGRGTVVVPMFYQDSVVGALAVSATTEIDPDVLAVLANNAAIATENARLFEQEKETVRRLLELDALKTDFLSTVQHELRTPLTAILGVSDLIELYWERWPDSQKLEGISDIQVAAKNLYDIVETIIDYSALEDERLGLNVEVVPVRAALDEALEKVGGRYKGGLPVPVTVECDDEVLVQADRPRLVQVLRALIDNAEKFSDGRGEVHVVVRPHNRDREVRIEVSDQGIGIPQDDLPRVFDRFYQVDNTATRRFGGTGMGLALVKRMVQAHDARVDIDSTPEQGTTVVLTWPAPERDRSGSDAPEDTAPAAPRRSRRRPVTVQ